ncbi:fibrinogen-like protein A [Clytia hemisphaerica]|uniref:Fibrinogen C-terminal domain-containing protein n=1 Tax=Clytia hemisphaerica TaxID=252671 RepID=A0A7M5TX38_9CNID
MKFLILLFLVTVLPSNVSTTCNDFTLKLNLLKQHVEMVTNLLTLTNQRLTDITQQLKQNLTKSNEILNEKLTKTNEELYQKIIRNTQTITEQITKDNEELEHKIIEKLTKKDQSLTQKVSQMTEDVQSLTQKDKTQNSFCQSNSHRCGSCYCIEDLRIPDKHYCDCRMKPIRRDCKEHHLQGERINGLYRINHDTDGNDVSVYCDQTTDGGGWTVIQRRVDGTTNFFRNWQTYKQGFGQLHYEHWLGNDNIHLLTRPRDSYSEIRFDLQRKDYGRRQYAKYSLFRIDNELNAYKLHISGFSGNIGQDKMNYHNGMKWSTRDRDNDLRPAHDCAYDQRGAWWYNGCETSNLNGIYDSFNKEKNPDEAFGWNPFRLEFSEMKVRRK